MRRKRGRAKSKENYKILQWVCPRVRGGREERTGYRWVKVGEIREGGGVGRGKEERKGRGVDDVWGGWV